MPSIQSMEIDCERVERANLANVYVPVRRLRRLMNVVLAAEDQARSGTYPRLEMALNELVEEP